MKFTSIYVCLLNLFFVSCTGTSSDGLTPIRFAYPSSGTIMNAQVGLIFEKTEILKRNGFKAELHPMNTGREMKAALVSGAVDVILTSEANFVVLLGEGFAATAIGSLGSAGRLALVVARESKYSDLRGLKGKSIATMYGTSLHEPALRWSKNAGANLISMSQIGAMMAALKSGQVDAIVTWDPFLAEALKKGEIRILEKENFTLINIASDRFLHEHREALNKLNHAFREAVVYLTGHKAEVNGWFAQMSGMSAETIDAATAANENYGKTRVEDVELGISSDYIRRLQSSADFFLKENLIRQSSKIADHVVK